MTSLPPEIIETLTKINTALKTLNKAVKDFSNISYDELLQRPAIDRAECYMSAMYTTTALAAINERLQGNDPENNDELQIEIKRVKKLETRLREQRDRHLRPRLNQFASQAFIRNAMFDVNAPSKNNIDTADSEMDHDSSDLHDNDDSEEVKEEIKSEEEDVDDMDS